MKQDIAHLSDRGLTTGTFGRKQFVVVVLTIGFAILFVELIWVQWNSALSALKALRMPVFAQGSNYFTLSTKIILIA